MLQKVKVHDINESPITGNFYIFTESIDEVPSFTQTGPYLEKMPFLLSSENFAKHKILTDCCSSKNIIIVNHNAWQT